MDAVTGDVTVEPVPTTLGGRRDPTSRTIRALASEARRRFAGAAMRLGDSDVVHAVRLRRWVGDETIPGPACRQGADIPDLSPHRHPVRDKPISCLRCLSLGELLVAEALDYTPTPQLVLPLPEVPDPPRRPRRRRPCQPCDQAA